MPFSYIYSVRSGSSCISINPGSLCIEGRPLGWTFGRAAIQVYSLNTEDGKGFGVWSTLEVDLIYIG